MSLQLDDTIAALASAPGPAAAGIVRISGPNTREVLASLFRPHNRERYAVSRVAENHAGTCQVSGFPVSIPVNLYFWPHARSYTGQSMAELHTFGSPPLLEALLSSMHSGGVRPARPGEFTLRAFLAGRLDLVQAEAVLGVIDAHGEVELESALGQLAGGLSAPLAQIRGDLLNLLADLEAGLDFVEEDIEFVGSEEMIRRLTAAEQFLEQLLSQAASRMQTTGRARVVLAGLPNAGKSTLFNVLAGREAALVSEVSGTTRDFLTAELNLNGTAVELIDTAGWDSPELEIELQAQSFSLAQLEDADLILWCSAADQNERDRALDLELKERLLQRNQPVLLLTTKSDCRTTAQPGEDLALSAQTGENLQRLITETAVALTTETSGRRQMLGTTASRCKESLSRALKSLVTAREAIALGAGDELIAIEVRAALDCLGEILGAVYTDDILDRIFSKFCIGK